MLYLWYHPQVLVNNINPFILLSVSTVFVLKILISMIRNKIIIDTKSIMMQYFWGERKYTKDDVQTWGVTQVNEYQKGGIRYRGYFLEIKLKNGNNILYRIPSKYKNLQLKMLIKDIRKIWGSDRKLRRIYTNKSPYSSLKYVLWFLFN